MESENIRPVAAKQLVAQMIPLPPTCENFASNEWLKHVVFMSDHNSVILLGNLDSTQLVDIFSKGSTCVVMIHTIKVANSTRGDNRLFNRFPSYFIGALFR